MSDFATDAGLEAFVNALVATNTPFVGWGAGSGQGETSTEVASPFGARLAGLQVASSTNTAGDTYRVSAAMTAAAAATVTEVGIFGSSGGADMQFYGDFPAINLAAGDSITFTIDVVVDQA